MAATGRSSGVGSEAAVSGVVRDAAVGASAAATSWATPSMPSSGTVIQKTSALAAASAIESRGGSAVGSSGTAGEATTAGTAMPACLSDATSVRPRRPGPITHTRSASRGSKASAPWLQSTRGGRYRAGLRRGAHLVQSPSSPALGLEARTLFN